ncbi:MAG: hypothetical protein Ta2D_00990 [Rickettsiales bacterium]|nr:MAG: hypothetical protein Ta2D_00990 [Rickettsiales bacterium]
MVNGQSNQSEDRYYVSGIDEYQVTNNGVTAKLKGVFVMNEAKNDCYLLAPDGTIHSIHLKESKNGDIARGEAQARELYNSIKILPTSTLPFNKEQVFQEYKQNYNDKNGLMEEFNKNHPIEVEKAKARAAEMENLKKENVSLKQDNKGLQGQVQTDAEIIKNLQAELAALKKDKEAVNEQNKKLENEVKKQQALTAEAQKEASAQKANAQNANQDKAKLEQQNQGLKTQLETETQAKTKAEQEAKARAEQLNKVGQENQGLKTQLETETLAKTKAEQEAKARAEQLNKVGQENEGLKNQVQKDQELVAKLQTEVGELNKKTTQLDTQNKKLGQENKRLGIQNENLGKENQKLGQEKANAEKIAQASQKEAEAQKANAQKANEEKAKSDAAKAKAEQETQKANEEKAKANAEKEKANAEKLKAETLAKNADAAKAKAEEEKAKAEQTAQTEKANAEKANLEKANAEKARQEAEAQKAKAEEVAKQKEEELKKTEEAKTKAEQETQKANADKLKAEQDAKQKGEELKNTQEAKAKAEQDAKEKEALLNETQKTNEKLTKENEDLLHEARKIGGTEYFMGSHQHNDAFGKDLRGVELLKEGSREGVFVAEDGKMYSFTTDDVIRDGGGKRGTFKDIKEIDKLPDGLKMDDVKKIADNHMDSQTQGTKYSDVLKNHEEARKQAQERARQEVEDSEIPIQEGGNPENPENSTPETPQNSEKPTPNQPEPEKITLNTPQGKPDTKLDTPSQTDEKPKTTPEMPPETPKSQETPQTPLKTPTPKTQEKPTTQKKSKTPETPETPETEESYRDDFIGETDYYIAKNTFGFDKKGADGKDYRTDDAIMLFADDGISGPDTSKKAYSITADGKVTSFDFTFKTNDDGEKYKDFQNAKECSPDELPEGVLENLESAAKDYVDIYKERQAEGREGYEEEPKHLDILKGFQKARDLAKTNEREEGPENKDTPSKDTPNTPPQNTPQGRETPQPQNQGGQGDNPKGAPIKTTPQSSEGGQGGDQENNDNPKGTPSKSTSQNQGGGSGNDPQGSPDKGTKDNSQPQGEGGGSDPEGSPENKDTTKGNPQSQNQGGGSDSQDDQENQYVSKRKIGETAYFMGSHQHNEAFGKDVRGVQLLKEGTNEGVFIAENGTMYSFTTDDTIQEGGDRGTFKNIKEINELPDDLKMDDVKKVAVNYMDDQNLIPDHRIKYSQILESHEKARGQEREQGRGGTPSQNSPENTTPPPLNTPQSNNPPPQGRGDTPQGNNPPLQNTTNGNPPPQDTTKDTPKDTPKDNPQPQNTTNGDQGAPEDNGKPKDTPNNNTPPPQGRDTSNGNQGDASENNTSGGGNQGEGSKGDGGDPQGGDPENQNTHAATKIGETDYFMSLHQHNNAFGNVRGVTLLKDGSKEGVFITETGKMFTFTTDDDIKLGKDSRGTYKNVKEVETLPEGLTMPDIRAEALDNMDKRTSGVTYTQVLDKYDKKTKHQEQETPTKSTSTPIKSTPSQNTPPPPNIPLLDFKTVYKTTEFRGESSQFVQEEYEKLMHLHIHITKQITILNERIATAYASQPVQYIVEKGIQQQLIGGMPFVPVQGPNIPGQPPFQYPVVPPIPGMPFTPQPAQNPNKIVLGGVEFEIGATTRNYKLDFLVGLDDVNFAEVGGLNPGTIKALNEMKQGLLDPAKGYKNIDQLYDAAMENPIFKSLSEKMQAAPQSKTLELTSARRLSETLQLDQKEYNLRRQQSQQSPIGQQQPMQTAPQQQFPRGQQQPMQTAPQYIQDAKYQQPSARGQQSSQPQMQQVASPNNVGFAAQHKEIQHEKMQYAAPAIVGEANAKCAADRYKKHEDGKLAKDAILKHYAQMGIKARPEIISKVQDAQKKYFKADAKFTGGVDAKLKSVEAKTRALNHYLEKIQDNEKKREIELAEIRKKITDLETGKDGIKSKAQKNADEKEIKQLKKDIKKINKSHDETRENILNNAADKFRITNWTNNGTEEKLFGTKNGKPAIDKNGAEKPNTSKMATNAMKMAYLSGKEIVNGRPVDIQNGEVKLPSGHSFNVENAPGYINKKYASLKLAKDNFKHARQEQVLDVKNQAQPNEPIKQYEKQYKNNDTVKSVDSPTTPPQNTPQNTPPSTPPSTPRPTTPTVTPEQKDLLAKAGQEAQKLQSPETQTRTPEPQTPKAQEGQTPQTPPPAQTKSGNPIIADALTQAQKETKQNTPPSTPREEPQTPKQPEQPKPEPQKQEPKQPEQQKPNALGSLSANQGGTTPIGKTPNVNGTPQQHNQNQNGNIL